MSTERRFANIGHLHTGTYLPLTAGATYPLTGDLWITSAQPNIWLTETDQAADTKVWRFVASNGVFYGQILTDTISAATTWLTVARTTYTGINNIAFNSTSTIQLISPYVDQISTANTLYGRIFYNTSTLAGYLCGNSDGIGFLTTAGSWGARMNGSTGHLYLYSNLTMLATSGVINVGAGGLRYGYFGQGTTYSNAASVFGNNIYVNPADAVSGQVRHAVTHPSYGHTIYEMYGGNHYWYGNGNSVTADAVVTKQLAAYLNYSGSLQAVGEFRIYGGVVAVNSTGYYTNTTAGRIVRDTAGSYSTISLYGSNGSYAGIRLDSASGTPNFMFATGSNLWGVYRESTSSWDILYNAGVMSINAQTQLVATAAAASWGGRCIMSRGTAAPSGGADGDIYFRTTTIGLYINLAGTWTLVAS